MTITATSSAADVLREDLIEVIADTSPATLVYAGQTITVTIGDEFTRLMTEFEGNDLEHEIQVQAPVHLFTETLPIENKTATVNGTEFRIDRVNKTPDGIQYNLDMVRLTA